MKKTYFVEPRSGAMAIAAALLVLAIGLRSAWWALWPQQAAGGRFWVLVALPVASCALFLLTLLAWGRDRLWISFFPAVLGVLFFLLKAETFVWWHRLLCTLLYLAVAALYGLTVFGAPIRKLLYPLFGLPLAFHLLVEDLILNRTAYTAAQWLQEGSVLCIMGALLAIALGMRVGQRPDHGRCRLL